MKTIGIIGGGIIGLCSAYYLQKDGHKITIIDQNNFTNGCSYVNAGMIVPSHVIPLAAPGMVSKGLRWMLHAKSPFHIQPSLKKDLLRWGILFYKSANKKNVNRAVPFLRDISWLSQSLYEELSKNINIGYSQKGLLMLYKTATVEKEEIETSQIVNQAGIEAHILSAREIQNMEPEIKVNVRGGIYFPRDAHLNPNILMNKLITFLKKSGVKFVSHSKIEDFDIRKNRIRSMHSKERKYEFDEFIFSTGVAAESLTKSLSINMPLQGGKGYSFDLTNRRNNIQIPSLLLEGKVSATPMGEDLRFGGTMEITRNTNSVNMKKVQGIVNTVNDFYPELSLSKSGIHQVNSGLRPCSPDGLPYIGRVSSIGNMTIATGHGMMGISLGPATGKIVSELIAGTNSSVNINAFNPERFTKKH